MQTANNIPDDDVSENEEAHWPPEFCSNAHPALKTPEDPWLDEVLTTKEAGDFLKVNASTLGKWRYYNTGPTYLKLGVHLVRYRRRDLITWLNSCTHAPSNDNGEA